MAGAVVEDQNSKVSTAKQGHVAKSLGRNRDSMVDNDSGQGQSPDLPGGTKVIVRAKAKRFKGLGRLFLTQLNFSTWKTALSGVALFPERLHPLRQAGLAQIPRWASPLHIA